MAATQSLPQQLATLFPSAHAQSQVSGSAIRTPSPTTQGGSANALFPRPDLNYVNVSIRLDPQWLQRYEPLWKKQFAVSSSAGTMATAAGLTSQLAAAQAARDVQGDVPTNADLGGAAAQAGAYRGGYSIAAASWVAMFMTLDEEGITESLEANYADTEITGRAESYLTYTGTTNREIPLTFVFHAQRPQKDPKTGAETGGGPMREVVWPCRWLEALKNPVINIEKRLSHAPPPVILNVGDLIKNARCVVTEANPHWLAPFEPGSMLPHGAEVSVTFRVVRKPSATPPKVNYFAYALG